MLAASAQAASPEQRFAQAQAAFEAAQARMTATSADPLETRRAFRQIAEQFGALAADGTLSASLCVNTGNAYHFAGDEPRALLWYLRASQLSNTPDIRAGLATLRRSCKAELWPPPRPSIGRVLMFWHYDLPRQPKQILLLTLYPLGCALVIASLFTRRPKPWRRAGLVLLILGGTMGISDILAATSSSHPWAVVLSPTKGYAGDGPMYSVVVPAIPPGQEVKLLETRRGWMQIELPSTTRCWVPQDTCQPSPNVIPLIEGQRGKQRA